MFAMHSAYVRLYYYIRSDFLTVNVHLYDSACWYMCVYVWRSEEQPWVSPSGTPSTSLGIETPVVQRGPGTCLSLPPRTDMSSTHYHIVQFSMGLRNQILVLVPGQVLYGGAPLPWAGFGHSDHRTLQLSPSSPAGSKLQTAYGLHRGVLENVLGY